jgi:hypothetical protein
MAAQFLVQTIRGMQCDMNLGNTYRHSQLLHVYKLCVRADKFTVISDHSRRMTSPSEARRFVKNSKDWKSTSDLLLHTCLHPDIETVKVKRQC